MFGLTQIWFVRFESPYDIDQLFFKIIALVVALLETCKPKSVDPGDWLECTVHKEGSVLWDLAPTRPLHKTKSEKQEGIIPIYQCSIEVQPYLPGIRDTSCQRVMGSLWLIYVG